MTESGNQAFVYPFLSTSKASNNIIPLKYETIAFFVSRGILISIGNTNLPIRPIA